MMNPLQLTPMLTQESFQMILCPPTPDTPEDPTELEIASAADNLETMMNSPQPESNLLFQPSSLDALPHL